MSACQASALSAIALQFVMTLEAYDAQVDELLSSRASPELYHQVSRQVDLMRMYAAELPQVSVAWVELLIRHFELTHGLWRVPQGGADAAELARLREADRAAALELRRRCLELAAKH